MQNELVGVMPFTAAQIDVLRDILMNDLMFQSQHLEESLETQSLDTPTHAHHIAQVTQLLDCIGWPEFRPFVDTTEDVG